MPGDISGAANIYIVTGYTDMRKSIDGLCAIVMDQLKEEPDTHSIYLFCGKRCDRIKVLLREPDGYVLLYKRLDVVHGKYRWPRNRSEVKPITWQQFDWLMSGLEIEQPKAAPYRLKSLILLDFPPVLWYNGFIKNGRKTMPRSAKDIRLTELKDTISKLNELITAQTKSMDSLQKTIGELRQELSSRQAEVDYLKAKLFGSSSEKRKSPFPGQMNLFEEMPDERIPEIIEPEIINVSAHKRERKPKASYEEMFDSLPRREVMLNTLTDEDKDCPACGTHMIPIGTETARTELVFHPAYLERVDYMAVTYECPICKDSLEPQFVKDEGGEPLVPHSYVSSGLAAHVMYGKFINALPYYRQEKDFKNQFGVTIGRGTMAHWTIYCAENYFLPMTGYFHRLLTGRKFVAADETPIQVLKEADRRPQSKSYVWLFRSGDDGLPPIILYQYHPTRNGDAAAKFFQGSAPGTYINADGYARYNKLKDFKRCCCYAHIRRYFLEAIPKGKEKDYTDPAVQGFLYCNKLFEYERTYREKGLSYRQIYNRRLKDQKPVIEAFMAWIEQQNAPGGSRLARALTYAGNQRPYMMTYLEDGRCGISNNLSENSIRPVTVGRRNWLFCDTGADASMIVYSLLETARANGLNPQKYLEYLLEARPDKNMSDEKLENMAPWNPKVQECCVNKS